MAEELNGNNKKHVSSKKGSYKYDIGCVPSKFWYGFVGSTLIVPLICKILHIDVKPDQDYLKEEGPIMVLSNHPSYLDPMVVERLTHGRPVNFVTGEFLFRVKYWGHWFKLGGAIPKKQFVVDTVAVKAMMKVLKRKGSLCIFPEATRFMDGKSIVFDDGVAKLIKKHSAALYIARSHGAYLTYPRWSKSGLRKGKITAEFITKIPGSKIKEMSVEEIQDVILKSMDYNENDYSRECNPIHVGKKPAAGMQNVAYMCPKCQKEFTMNLDEGNGDTLVCSECGNSVKILPNGLLSQVKPDDVIYDDLHKWNMWEKDVVKKQLEDPDFKFELKCELYKVFDRFDFANTGSGTVTITPTDIIYKGTDCDSQDGIPYHKGKVRKGYTDRSLDGVAQDIERVFNINSMKGLVIKLGKCFEIYDDNGELFRFHVDGQKVLKVHQIVSLLGKLES